MDVDNDSCNLDGNNAASKIKHFPQKHKVTCRRRSLPSTR